MPILSQIDEKFESQRKLLHFRSISKIHWIAQDLIQIPALFLWAGGLRSELRDWYMHEAYWLAKKIQWITYMLSKLQFLSKIKSSETSKGGGFWMHGKAHAIQDQMSVMVSWQEIPVSLCLRYSSKELSAKGPYVAVPECLRKYWLFFFFNFSIKNSLCDKLCCWLSRCGLYMSLVFERYIFAASFFF